MSSGTVTRTPSRTSRAARLDAVCAAAVDTALDAARDAAGEGEGLVGEHLEAVAEGDRVVTHSFRSGLPGYRGWRWSVTVTRAPRSRHVTVSEVTLLPGPESLRAPEWLPWSERLRPGDLGVGDLLPTAPDDDRLAPGYVQSDDPAVAETNAEIGFGRPRVMSRLGREETAERWYASDAGPGSDLAKAAPARCGTCGFYLPLAGSLRALFGACANLFAPDDGRVVSADHGCGAHSEALVEPAPPVAAPPVVLDDAEVDVVPLVHTPGSVTDTAPAEPFGHG